MCGALYLCALDRTKILFLFFFWYTNRLVRFTVHFSSFKSISCEIYHKNVNFVATNGCATSFRNATNRIQQNAKMCFVQFMEMQIQITDGQHMKWFLFAYDWSRWLIFKTCHLKFPYFFFFRLLSSSLFVVLCIVCINVSLFAASLFCFQMRSHFDVALLMPYIFWCWCGVGWATFTQNFMAHRQHKMCFNRSYGAHTCGLFQRSNAFFFCSLSLFFQNKKWNFEIWNDGNGSHFSIIFFFFGLLLLLHLIAMSSIVQFQFILQFYFAINSLKALYCIKTIRLVLLKHPAQASASNKCDWWIFLELSI